MDMVDFKRVLISFCCALPFLAPVATAQDWSEEVKSDMVVGCVSTLRQNVVVEARGELGLGPDDPLPQELNAVLEKDFMPGFQNACRCTVDRVAEQYSYEEVQRNPELLRREAQLVDTAQGCPLNIG
jgi:hypothetical protein